jgi:hypothetical protein
VTLEADGGFGLPLDVDETFSRLVGVLDHGLASIRNREAAERTRP